MLYNVYFYEKLYVRKHLHDTNFQAGNIAIIDIYSRVDGALAALLAFRLKSCDSVDCRLTAGREQRPPASETRGGSLATARSLQRSRIAAGWRARKNACLNGGEQ